MGRLESPRWYFFEFSPDPSKHIVLTKVTQLDGFEFDRMLSGRLAHACRPELLLFIHGYNVSFEGAALRTAQLAYDLGQEVPVFYSWPSQAETSGYPADEATVEWATPHLVQFLERLVESTDSQTINVVAHSMGNRALIRALFQFAQEMPAAKFRNVILAAPDIDAATFRDLANEFSRFSNRSTLYASKRDKALMASRDFHRAPRAGDAGQNIVVVDGIDTIDASAVETDFLSHSYFAEKTLVSDMLYILNLGLPPDNRSGLRRRNLKGKAYWALVP